jgi:hypothetical protein
MLQRRSERRAKNHGISFIRSISSAVAKSFILGLAMKAVALMACVALVMLGLSWYRIREVRNFCADLVGLRRDIVDLRARSSGLTFRRRKTADEIGPSGWSPALVWCIASHDQETIRAVKVVVE